jgi:hypothetical protein
MLTGMADGAPVQQNATDVQGDLYTGFESYRTPTKADYESLFSGGMIVLDANVLLDLYLYHKTTRDVFISVLVNLQGHIWAPHQVLKEFWKNRDSKLRDPRESDATSRDLQSRSIAAVSTLRAWSNRVRLPKAKTDQLSDMLSQAFEAVTAEVEKVAADDGREFAHDTNRDPLLLAIAPIFRGRVGPPFNAKDYAAAAEEARLRIKERRPPGYMDGGKDGSGPIGDYLVWAQILREAMNRKQDVLFVTSDDKEDWWRQDKDKKSLGPRPELAVELETACGKRLFMLPPDSLLYWAREILGIEVSEESVQEVKRLSVPDVEITFSPRAFNQLSELSTDEQILVETMFERLHNSLREGRNFTDLPNGSIDLKSNGMYLLRWSDDGRAMFRVEYQPNRGSRIAISMINKKKSIDDI